MSAPPSPVLRTLAVCYRLSKAGREGTGRDFTLDYRELLARCGCGDGEARVRAEEVLQQAVHLSEGSLTLDRHPRDATIVHRVRLGPGGEAWLFSQLGEPSPSAQREALAAGFREYAVGPHSPHAGWGEWLGQLEVAARAGRSVKPFTRDDLAGNRALLDAIRQVLTWSGESLIRYASAVICHDSKQLERWRGKIEYALAEITGKPQVTLQDCGILEAPRSVLVHGPLVLNLAGKQVDLSALTGPVALSKIDLEQALSIECRSSVCLTVENLTVFHELAKRRPEVLLLHTSYPGSAALALMARLPDRLGCYHFGDSDPAGFDILRDLRARSGRQVRPVLMDYRPGPGTMPLSKAESSLLERLLTCEELCDIYEPLRRMRAAGDKGAFEQELLGVAGLDEVLAVVAQSSDPGDDRTE